MSSVYRKVNGREWYEYPTDKKKGTAKKIGYLGQWAGPRTARYRIGPLWFGYNCNTKHWFAIWNGWLISWQIQNWSPRFTFWRTAP